MVTLTVHSDTGEELVTLGLEPQAMLGDRCTNQVFPFAVSTGIYCIYHIKSTYTVVGYIYIYHIRVGIYHIHIYIPTYTHFTVGFTTLVVGVQELCPQSTVGFSDGRVFSALLRLVTVW